MGGGPTIVHCPPSPVHMNSPSYKSCNLGGGATIVNCPPPQSLWTLHLIKPAVGPRLLTCLYYNSILKGFHHSLETQEPSSPRLLWIVRVEEDSEKEIWAAIWIYKATKAMEESGIRRLVLDAIANVTVATCTSAGLQTPLDFVTIMKLGIGLVTIIISVYVLYRNLRWICIPTTNRPPIQQDGNTLHLL